MPKRVSLKGKGADLFFGDYTPRPADASHETTEAVHDSMAQSEDPVDLAAARLQDSVHASQPPSMQAVQQAPEDVVSHEGSREPQAEETPDVPVERQAGKQAGLRASKQSRRRAPQAASEQESTPPAYSAEAVLSAIWSDVCQQAPITGSFRYTERELSALTDATYELSKRHGVKFSKQDVARLALNSVLWDYQLHGDESLLTAFVLRKRRQREGQ